jgi:hypothetical protein
MPLTVHGGTAIVVERVTTAQNDPVVGCEPEQVEEALRVQERLAPAPGERRDLGFRQGSRGDAE